MRCLKRGTRSAIFVLLGCVLLSVPTFGATSIKTDQNVESGVHFTLRSGAALMFDNGSQISGGYLYRDINTMATAAITGALVGKTTANEPIYSTLDNATPSYARSGTSWAHGFDLTGVSVWSSTLSAPAHTQTATLISPRDVIMAHHDIIGTNETMRFVAPDGTYQTRTLSSHQQVGTTDIEVGHLSADLPSNFHVYKVLANQTLENVLIGSAVVFLDQFEYAFSADIASNTSGILTIAQSSDSGRAPFWKSGGLISGDSSHPVFAILDGEPVLLLTFHNTSTTTATSDSLAQNFDAINTKLAALGSTYRLTPFQGSALNLQVGTAGSDASFAGKTLNLPNASATTRGVIPAADWSRFDAKIGSAVSDGGSGAVSVIRSLTGTALHLKGLKPGANVTISDDGAGNLTLDAPPAGGGATNFLDLIDVPHTYSGAAGKIVVVNPAATGLQFVPSNSISPVQYRTDISTIADLQSISTVGLPADNADGGTMGVRIQFYNSGDPSYGSLVTYTLVDGDYFSGDVTPSDYNGTTNNKFWKLTQMVNGNGDFNVNGGALYANVLVAGSGGLFASDGGQLLLQGGALGNTTASMTTQGDGTLHMDGGNQMRRFRYSLNAATTLRLPTIASGAIDDPYKVRPGWELIFSNGSTSGVATLQDSTGATLATVQAGESIYLYAYDTTPTWQVVSRFQNAARQTFSNAAVTVAPGKTNVAQTGTMSAARVVTFPPASSYANGTGFTLIDESGTVGATNKLTATRAGSDTINGGTTFDIVTPFAAPRFISDGTSKWTTDIQGVGRGGTGATTAAGALVNLSAGHAPDIQFYSASGTWTRPSWATSTSTTTVTALGPGGGGGGGALVASGTACSGGAGGAPGGYRQRTFKTLSLGATETVTIGAAGSAGAAQATNSTQGNDGGAGTTSTTFGSWIVAGAGGGGQGGRIAAASTGGSSSGRSSVPAAPGANGANGAAGGGASSASLGGAAPGGAGGGISTTPAAFAGGNGINPDNFLGGVGGAIGASGTNATSSGATNDFVPGASGGGGGSSIAGNGGNSGTSADFGAGGSGGGSALNGNTSGAGAAGKAGAILVITQG